MIRPYTKQGKPGFVVTFRHPDVSVRRPAKGKGPKLVSAGLGTLHELEAAAYCRDLDRLCSTPDDWQDVKRCLAKYERMAVQVFFGREHPALAGLPERPRLEPQDVGTLRARILHVLKDAPKLGLTPSDAVGATLQHYEVDRFKTLQTERDNALRELTEAQAKIQDMNEDISRLRRAQNVHVKARIGAAWDQYALSSDYTELSPKTQNEIEAAAESFIKTLPESERFRLSDLRAAHIGSWLDKLKSERTETGKLSAVTKAKLKRYLSVFLGWSVRTYDLSENPMDKTGPVKGASIRREDITAMRTDQLKDFKEMLATLEEVDPYWHALVSTACLAGPRYAELCWLKLEHVNLEGNYLRIATRRDGDAVKGTKTGRERSIPIESTTLREILAGHLERRQKEQHKKNATENERSPWLFPSTVEGNPFKPRTKTPPGLWSDNGVFQDAWDAVAEKGQEKTGKRDYWTFGPREWRHCAGTAMGYSGNDSLRISAWLGNSEDVCKRHYVRPSTSGKLWPFRWH